MRYSRRCAISTAFSSWSAMKSQHERVAGHQDDIADVPRFDSDVILLASQADCRLVHGVYSHARSLPAMKANGPCKVAIACAA